MSGISVISQLFSKIAVRLSGKHFLPCYVLSREPLVLASYWMDFLNNRDDIYATLPADRNVYFLIQFGWHKETEEKMREVAKQANEVTASRTNLKLVFLCNSEREQELCAQVGLKGVFCHQNAFLDETRYPIIGNSPKKYDAVYLARISPFKRHALAANVEKLKLIGDYKPQEEEHFNKIMGLLKQADWNGVLSVECLGTDENLQASIGWLREQIG